MEMIMALAEAYQAYLAQAAEDLLRAVAPDPRIAVCQRAIESFYNSNSKHNGDPQARHDAALFALGKIAAIIEDDEKR